MKAENQNMEFVNDTLELAEESNLIRHSEEETQKKEE